MIDTKQYVKLLNEQKADTIATIESTEKDIVVRAKITNAVLAAQSFADLRNATGAYMALCYYRAVLEQKTD